MSNAFSEAYLEARIEGQVQHFALSAGGVLRIGRRADNDVLLKDGSVGHQHAIIESCGDGLFSIMDLGSYNGTFVNGARLTAPVVLRAADRVRIGRIEFTFQQPE